MSVNTLRLFGAILDGDLEHVKGWCKRESADINRKDYTGRIPLHLPMMSGTSEIVQCLISHGARWMARVTGSFTALHVASWRGSPALDRALLEKSEANDEEVGSRSQRERRDV
jgi:ankyrin repeat protein